MYVLHHNPSVCGYFESTWHWEQMGEEDREWIAEELMEYLWNNEKYLRNVFPIKTHIWDEKKNLIGIFELTIDFEPKFKVKEIMKMG